MKNDFLQSKIDKELNKKFFQFSIKYSTPFIVLLSIDLIYILHCFGYSLTDISSFANKYSSVILIFINSVTLFYSTKKNRRERINFIKDSNPKLEINIEAKVHKNEVILNCQAKNISKVDFSLKNCYVYIDSGIYNTESKEYEFPFIQNKNINIMEKSETDCIASFYCKNKICHYPESLITRDFSHTKSNYECYNLNHLSLESLAYIGSNECFNQEIVVHLEQGIYRALMVAIPDESCDCKCYSVCFIVD